MSTVALQIWTGAYPSITNDIEIRVYAESDPLAIIASLRHVSPHPADTWSFAGLTRTNYVFRIFEMSGSSIVQQLGDDMNVVPGSANGVAKRVTEQIQADVTVGFASGVNVVTFDGTGGRPDWRGWDIDTLDRVGQDTIIRGRDYSYDPTLGRLTLLNAGDVFNPNEWFNVQFALQITDTTTSVPVVAPVFSTPKIITANYPIDAGTDFGGLLIVKPSGNYIELTFPDIATVVAGKLITIEMGPSSINKCCKLIFQSGQYLDWLLGNRPDLYICPQESISIYKFIDTTGSPVSQWRIFNPYGNFLRVGEQIVDDNIAANVFNKIPLDGSRIDTQQFARLYNDFVLNLPSGEVVDYDTWATGNNKYKFSKANSSNPANNGKFFVPNRMGQFERITDGTRKPGDFESSMVGSFTGSIRGRGAAVGGGNGGVPNIVPLDTNIVPPFLGPLTTVANLPITAGTETRPADVAIRKYLLV